MIKQALKLALKSTLRRLYLMAAAIISFAIVLAVLFVIGIPIYYFLINYCNYTFAWILGGILDIGLGFFVVNFCCTYIELREAYARRREADAGRRRK